MILTSAVKSIATFNEMPRNVNLLQEDVGPNSNVEWGATDKGTPIVYYSSAIAETAVFTTFELMFDTFPDDLIQKFGDAMSNAGKIPLFATASTYLLAAGALLKIVASTGHTLFDGTPAFKATETITFTRPGDPPSVAGWLIIDQESPKDDFLRGYTVGEGGQLYDAQNKPYAGEYPYIVISLDGAEQRSYANFTPTAATAALLEKFFRTKDRDVQVLQDIEKALKLYNDFQFRRDAESLARNIDELKKKDPNDPQIAVKQKELDALKKNIVEELLKMP